MTSVPKRRDPIELRVEWQEAWTAADRAWDRQRDKCECHQPRHGPSYFKVVRCTACSRRIT